MVDHSDVVGALPVGAAPTTSSYSTWYLASMDWTKTNTRRDKKQLKFGIWCTDLTVVVYGNHQTHFSWADTIFHQQWPVRSSEIFQHFKGYVNTGQKVSLYYHELSFVSSIHAVLTTVLYLRDVFCIWHEKSVFCMDHLKICI